MLLLQNGLAEATSKSRKQIKERKNRTKKIRGVKKNAGALRQCSGQVAAGTDAYVVHPAVTFPAQPCCIPVHVLALTAFAELKVVCAWRSGGQEGRLRHDDCLARLLGVFLRSLLACKLQATSKASLCVAALANRSPNMS